ncbi:flagellar motor protein MotB [Ampullimonas aquatilis]|uniref:flagellar motor protein MotB n=1 Tax=Ampullimonas aquatilis TaxID=1341549 RepID=UPI003C748095
MADNKGEAPIIVKKIKKVSGGGHHGGAWKIAYADFVTAMMAFFLLMWLLGSTTKGDLQGISDYFNTPLKVAMAGGSGSGDSSSVIQGGGKDLTRSNGQVKNSNAPKSRKTINFQAAKAELERKEKEMLEGLKVKIESLIDSSIKLQQFKDQIRMDITNEGLRIQIVDEQNRAMFDSGKAAMKDYTREILKEIARALNDVDNRIAISGHTDSAPFSSGERGYSNWELSADRANACRREMVAAGLADNKIIRVLGLASSVPFKKDDPLDASNRRISIIVMNKRAEETILNDGVPVDVSTPEDAGESIQMMDSPGNEKNSAPIAVPSTH